MAKISTNKFLILFLFAGSYIGLLMGYWWIAIILSLLFGYFYKNNLRNTFLISFFTVFLLYILLAIFNDSNFEHSPARLLGDLLGNISSSLVFFLAGFIPAILGGLASICGKLFK